MSFNQVRGERSSVPNSGTGEYISLHVGQAGSRTGRAGWELFCKEQGLDETGRQLSPEELRAQRKADGDEDGEDGGGATTDARGRQGSYKTIILPTDNPSTACAPTAYSVEGWQDDGREKRGTEQTAEYRTGVHGGQAATGEAAATALDKEWKHIMGTSSPINGWFTETEQGYYTPKAVFADLDPDVRDDLLGDGNRYRGLYRAEQVVSGREDAASLYSCGYYTAGRELAEFVEDSIRDQAELCNKPQGFLVTHSIGGGTGSGLGARILEYLREEFPKSTIIETFIIPSCRRSDSTVSPYNSVLATNKTLGDSNDSPKSDMAIIIDNQSMFNIFKQKYGFRNPEFKHLNQMVAQLTSYVTSSMRMDCPAGQGLRVNWSELQTNLVPERRLHYIIPAFAPLLSPSVSRTTQPRVDQLMYHAFKHTSQLAKCDLQHPSNKLMGCCMLFRGQANPFEINQALQKFKNSRFNNFKKMFVDWLMTGIKTGFDPNPQRIQGDLKRVIPKVKRSLCMLTNSTATHHMWDDLTNQFDLMYRKNAFVHHYYNEGLEMDEFSQARETLASLSEKYREIAEGRDNVAEYTRTSYHSSSSRGSSPMSTPRGKPGAPQRNNWMS